MAVKGSVPSPGVIVPHLVVRDAAPRPAAPAVQGNLPTPASELIGRERVEPDGSRKRAPLWTPQTA